jgi:tRNA/tmRNA/rRNA uracil-C5-methylase (TrmA/RlmC/RlmD family)
MTGLLEGIHLSHICNEIIPSSLGNGFRSRAKFRVFPDKTGMRIEGTDPRCGFVAFEKSLWILPDWSRNLIREVSAFVQKNHRDFVVDGFEIQLIHGQKKAHITFSVNKSIKEFYDEFAIKVLTQIPEIVGVAIPSQKLEVGETFLVHKLVDKDFCAHYDSFFQSNLELAPKLLEHVVRISKSLTAQEIYDFYCGVGLLSLSVGEKNVKIIGIDNNRMAIRSARLNAHNMDFHSAKYFLSSAERFIQTTKIKANSLVLINPPRSGCAPSFIKGIASQNPKDIILVSCSLRTHVHDLALWIKRGFAILSLKAFDMFPFTDFLETVTELKINS